jgi:hypothetical protein
MCAVEHHFGVIFNITKFLRNSFRPGIFRGIPQKFLEELFTEEYSVGAIGGERATGQRGGGLFHMIKFVRWICFWHPEASGVVEETRNLIYPAKDISCLVWERTGISILL